MSDPLPWDLCLRLKEAGWKQPKYGEGAGDWVCFHNGIGLTSDCAYSPSLEELIEACPPAVARDLDFTGGREWKPSKIGGESEALFAVRRDFTQWVAGYDSHAWHLELECDGATPKIAVALLWLKLQETKTEKENG